MDKSEFVSQLARRFEASPGLLESVVDSTLAQIVSPSVFGSAEEVPALLRGDNNCNNNCAAEAAVASPVLRQPS